MERSTPSSSEEPQRFGHHHNAFGFIRLFLASLVIVSHTAELAYGNRSHEPLVALAGTLSLGDVAVYGFFIVSGYLITGSFLKAQTAGDYFLKRVVRIYPGFLAAFLVCVGVFAPLGGAPFAIGGHRMLNLIGRAALLQEPSTPFAFAGTPYPVVDGSMWTIAYEFRCYMLVAVLGLIGIFRHRRVFLALAAIMILVTALPLGPALESADRHSADFVMLTGKPSETLPLTAMFLSGAAFYLFREEVAFSRGAAAIALTLLVVGLFFAPLAHPAAATAGAYLVLAVAHLGGTSILARINNDNDVSYGVYLYAWPLTKLLYWWVPSLDLAVVGLVTWLGAVGLGTASWYMVEKPAMRALRSALRMRSRKPVPLHHDGS